MTSQHKEREPRPERACVRLLHLEDNAVEAELIARRLKADGLAAECTVVADELAFRRAIVELAPHLIISDFSLPGFDGLSALRIAVEQAPATPFIFVSGTIGEERAIEALKRGAADYVLKDNLNRLVPAIRAALRQAEAARARDLAEEMVRRGEARLKDIINTSRDWIWECDADGRFTFSSPSVREILGYAHHELLGRPATDFVVPGDELQLHTLLSAEPAEAVDTEPATPVALRWRHKNGKIRWLERTIVALRDANGALVGFRGSDRDVTSRVAQDVRIRRLNRALRFMGGASSAVMRIRDRKQLLREACRLAVSVGGYAGATLYLLPLAADGAQAEVCSYRNAQSGGSRWSQDGVLPHGVNPVTQALATTNPFIVNDLEGGAESGLEFVPHSAELVARGVRALIALPLVIDGTAIGVLELHSAEANVFGEAELLLLAQIAANVAFALQYLHSRESAEYLQYFDSLTSLANRSLYRQRVAAMLESLDAGDTLALLALDLSGLGMVNDGLGHHAGDLLLQLVAERLKNTFRDSGLLCRLGGDRFAVLARGHGDETAATLERQTIGAFAEPFAIRDRELRVSIHAGIAQTPGDAPDADALLQHAQTALEHAKDAGRRCLRHRAHMNAKASQRLELTNDLRRAVAERAFVLCYQPKVTADSGAFAGVEALLRWPRAGAAAVSPAEFVPMLESLGLIEEVGEWAIVRALLESGAWPVGGAGVRVAVNVSALQLGREDFAERTLELLADVPDGAGRLELEVTESAVMADPARAAASLAKLRDAGVTIAIDDFGTGHSSLKMLSSLPADVLKIDRSFVRDVVSNASHRSIVQATITLARSLGLRTVAEGVETAEQLEAIAALGCDYAQGYLIARPASAAETGAWIARHAREQAASPQPASVDGATRRARSVEGHRAREPGARPRRS